MTDDLHQRASDQGTAAAAAGVVKTGSRTLWTWIDKHHIDALSVLGVTLWLTVQVVLWAMDFADLHATRDSNSVAAIIAAVLTPWGIAQSAMVKFYMDLKAATKGNGNGAQGNT